MKSQHTVFVVVAIACVLILASVAAASVPRQISYQGKATDASGNPVPDADYQARFFIYDRPTAGNLIWGEAFFTIHTTGGLFTHLLGSIVPIPDSLFSNYDSLFLEVWFNLQALTPRTPLVSTGYAFRVNSVDGATGGTISGDVIIADSSSNTASIRLDESGATDWIASNSSGDFYLLSAQGGGSWTRLFISSTGTTVLAMNGGDVGIGTSPSTRLHVSAYGADVATFNRNTNDGTIIRINQAGVTEGTISVAGTTVSYNAFTGSHYGWTDEALERGELVTLTGANRSSHDNPESEIVYGIKRSTAPNDPACFGSYLALQSPTLPYSAANPHLIMAAGNGDMWVVDEGQDIQPGDYLISSSTPGHAMKDDEVKYPIGHVVARAAEAVDWGSVSQSIDGRKHKRISILFGNFVRSGDATVRKLWESQQQQIYRLEKKLEEIQGQLLQAKL